MVLDVDIGLNCKVELHFALRLSDTGELVDSTFGKKPASLVIGDGNLPVRSRWLFMG